MILVTGGNGPFGGAIVRHLLQRVPATDLAVSVRDPQRAQGLASAGVSVRVGDFDEPDNLSDAFQGASTILLNGTNYGAAVTGHAVAQQTAAIRAAEQAGAERIVITSWQDLDHCPLEFADAFRTIEALATATFDTATVLRLTWGMAASVARDVRSAIQTGVLRAPAGGAAIAPAAVEDLALAAANVLTDGDHAADIYDLAGPNRITWTDLAALASSITGRSIEYQTVTDAEFTHDLTTTGFPPDAIKMLLDYYAAFRAGWGSTTPTDLAALLHAPPTPSIEAVRAALA